MTDKYITVYGGSDNNEFNSKINEIINHGYKILKIDTILNNNRYQFVGHLIKEEKELTFMDHYNEVLRRARELMNCNNCNLREIDTYGNCQFWNEDESCHDWYEVELFNCSRFEFEDKLKEMRK